MKCPNCNVDLVMSERQNVEIDYCPQCRGVWLDKGELDKIIDRNASYESPGYNQPEQYRDEQKRYEGGHQGKYYPHKKKKGFLGDLFDFD